MKGLIILSAVLALAAAKPSYKYEGWGGGWGGYDLAGFGNFGLTAPVATVYAAPKIAYAAPAIVAAPAVAPATFAGPVSTGAILSGPKSTGAIITGPQDTGAIVTGPSSTGAILTSEAKSGAVLTAAPALSFAAPAPIAYAAPAAVAYEAPAPIAYAAPAPIAYAAPAPVAYAAPAVAYAQYAAPLAAGVVTKGGGTIGVSGDGAIVKGPPTAPVIIAGPSGKIKADGLWGPTLEGLPYTEFSYAKKYY